VPDIFDEVQEDLRAERMRRLATRYGGLLAGLAMLLVLGVAAQQGWQWWQGRNAAAAATAFLTASDAATASGADHRASADRFASLAETAPSGYATLARLRAAALRAEAEERDAALAGWDAVARDTQVPAPYRELAALLWALHAVDADPAGAEARLIPLATGDGPWRFAAEEIRALAALRRGESAVARRSLSALAGDQSAPEGVRQRAGRLLAGMHSL